MITRSRVSHNTPFLILKHTKTKPKTKPRTKAKKPLPAFPLKNPSTNVTPLSGPSHTELALLSPDHSSIASSIVPVRLFPDIDFSDISTIEQQDDDTWSKDSEDSVISEDLDLDLDSVVSHDIDFDDARDEWATNKRRGPNGTYVYICGFRQKNHKLCQIACCDKIGLYSGCKRHFMWEEKQHKLL